MKNILALICSPRKLGNCEIAVKEICRQLPEENNLKLLRLSDFNIQSCTGCYTCLFKKGKCKLEDDLPIIIQEMCQADAIILASPTYFLGPNATLKNLLDRGLCFYAYADSLWDKPAIGIGLAGLEGKEGYNLLGLENFLKIIMSKVKGVQILYGALPGEVLQRPENNKKMQHLANALFSSVPETIQPCCPLCGSKTFRFLQNNQVKCMLCSNSGEIDTRNGQISFTMTPDAHDFFLSKQTALEHMEWLKGMKDIYRKKKKELDQICSDYQNDGQWITHKVTY